MGIRMLFLCSMVSFFVSFLFCIYWIKRARKADGRVKLIGSDIHKKNVKVAEPGGIPVISGFLAGIFSYIAIVTFVYGSTQHLAIILSALIVMLIIAMMGFIDDILEWQIGLTKKTKPILCFLAAIPLSVINAGYSIVYFPFIGIINLGLLYPILIIPIAVMGASNGFNMLAGYNGLEAGQGILILASLGVILYLRGEWAAVMAFCAIASLFAFLYFNKYPAKIFPGDSVTYPIGALIAILAIIGNVEKVALILFIPYFAEFFLKARGRMKKQSFAKLEKDGSLSLLYKKIYGLEHLAIVVLSKIKPSRKVYEKDVVWFIRGIQLIFVIITFSVVNL